MGLFLATQLDFIFFFYGLAFMLLGAVCFSIARGAVGKAARFDLLGWFGLVHGGSEWLDLTALIIDDGPAFQALRTTVMAASYLFPLEFARLAAIRLGAPMPGRWIYVPLLMAVVATGIVNGQVSANILARYLLGAPGAFGTCAVMIIRARTLEILSRPLVLCAAACFALYGVAAGLIVPTGEFWPANTLNQNWFVTLTGVPIQLVRGLLAAALAVMMWSVWGRLQTVAVGSNLYTAYLQRHFFTTLAALAVIFAGGWALTNFLGDIYKENIQTEAQGDLKLLVSRLEGETATVDAMVRALSGSRSVHSLLTGGGEAERAQTVLGRNVEASGATLGQILDMSGAVIASSDRAFGLLGAPNAATTLYFRVAMAGGAGREFVQDNEGGPPGYVASYPIRREDETVVGVAMLKKSLVKLSTSLQSFDRPFFFVDGNGVVMLSNRPGNLNRGLWPIGAKATIGEQFGASTGAPMLASEITDAAWTMFNGRRSYVMRSAIPQTEWSMLIVTPLAGMFASRLLGIIITLQLALTALFHFLGKEHGVRDSVQMQSRSDLQTLADSLEVKANTDPLTGLYNRAKFNVALAHELARAQRYGTAFSLIVCDIDRFKEVNDAHGHQAGDLVLVQLSAIFSAGIRQTDLLARWGGEEFVLVLPATDVLTAALVAEKLRRAVAQSTFASVGTITCSFGVGEYVAGDSVESLMARTDNALYRAKLNGRNRVECAAPVTSPDLAPMHLGVDSG